MSVVIETTAGDITVDLYTKVSYIDFDNDMIIILINFKVHQ